MPSRVVVVHDDSRLRDQRWQHIKVAEPSHLLCLDLWIFPDPSPIRIRTEPVSRNDTALVQYNATRLQASLTRFRHQADRELLLERDESDISCIRAAPSRGSRNLTIFAFQAFEILTHRGVDY